MLPRKKLVQREQSKHDRMDECDEGAFAAIQNSVMIHVDSYSLTRKRRDLGFAGNR